MGPELHPKQELGEVGLSFTLRVHVPSNWVLKALRIIVIILQILGEYLNIGYLDP